MLSGAFGGRAFVISEAFYSTVLISWLLGALDLSAVLPGVIDSLIVLSWASVSTIALCGFFVYVLPFIGLSIFLFANTALSCQRSVSD